VRKLVVLPLVVALGALVAAGGTTASTAATQWKAKLSATEVEPKQAVKNTSASGSFSAKAVGNKLQFKLTFNKLSGPATGAHIGYGKKGKPGNFSLAICAPCPNPTVNTLGLNPALTQAFKSGLLYVEVVTRKNPNGEIRGQLG
jgi:CHRD domain-containing protein